MPVITKLTFQLLVVKTDFLLSMLKTGLNIFVETVFSLQDSLINRKFKRTAFI